MQRKQEEIGSSKLSSVKGKRSRQASAAAMDPNYPYIAKDEDLTALPGTTSTTNEVATSIRFHQNLMPRRDRPSIHSSDDDSSLDCGGAEDDKNRGNVDNDGEEDPFAELQQLLERQTWPVKRRVQQETSLRQQPEPRKSVRELDVSVTRSPKSNISSQQNPVATDTTHRPLQQPSLLSQGDERKDASTGNKALQNIRRSVDKDSISVHWSARALGGSLGRMLHSIEKTNVATTVSEPFRSESIVGSRPDHWISKKPNKKNTKKTMHSSSNTAHDNEAAARVAKLAEATKKRRFLLLGSPRVVSPAKRGPASSQTQDGTASKRSTPGLFDCSQADNPIDTTQMGDLLTPRPPGYGNQLAMVESIAGNNSGSPGCTPLSVDQAKRKGSSKRLRAHGPLMSRLVTLRREDDADCVRLRSSTYTTNSHMMNLSDPRRSAKSVMVVTIAGEPLGWESEKELVTVLGYVHSHVDTNDTVITDQSIAAQQFVTMFFTFETARQQRIRRSLQLRLYNVVVIPSHNHVAPSRSIHDQQEATESAAAVVCTRLCEPYPASLPTLPSLPGLTDNPEGTAEDPHSWNDPEGDVSKEHFI